GAMQESNGDVPLTIALSAAQAEPVAIGEAVESSGATDEKQLANVDESPQPVTAISSSLSDRPPSRVSQVAMSRSSVSNNDDALLAWLSTPHTVSDGFDNDDARILL